MQNYLELAEGRSLLVAIAKAKINETAQKLVTQGKLREAIAEYQKILKEEPKDVNTLNSVGDLYVRLNNIPEALQYFTKLADIYVSDGFLVRGIAMYKKIAKLDPPNTHAGERLAELYTMQGLFGEARSQYLQLAEAYLKSKKAQEAMNILQKLLDLEPDNLQIQQRLAELYQEHGRKDEAAHIYRRVAERLLQREETDQALKWLEKASKLAPENPQVLLTRARLLVEQGDASAASALLEKIPKLGESPEVLELLLKCRVGLGEVDEAAKLAEDVFARNPQHFGGLLQVAEQLAQQDQRDRAVALFQRIAEPALEHGEPARVIGVLRHLVGAGAAAAAEWLVTAARKASDHDALVTGLSTLAKQCFEKKEFERAREFYEELVQLAPEAPEYAQRLQKVKERLGGVAEPTVISRAEPVAEAAVISAAAVAAAAEGEVALVKEEDLDPDTRAYVTSSLTDIDLFSSYGMTQKAVELAEQLVQRVPGHLVANEQLLDFYVGSGNEQQVSVVARRLEQLYRQKGDLDRVEQVAQIAARYEQKVGAPVAAAPVEEVREVDLSAEWAATAEEAPALEVELPQFKADEVREEIGFYIDQGMLKEARMALDRYTEQFPDEPVLAELRQRLQAAAAPKPKPAPAPAPPPAPQPVEEISLAEVSEVAEEVEEAAPAPQVSEPAEVAAAPGENYEIALEEKPQQASSMSATDFFSDLAGELEAALPAEVAAEAKAPAPAKFRVRAAESPEGVAALTKVFDEFKQELGAVEEVEDIETHYNLGIAFKEMGLYDEAISEFQKVYKAAENEQAYPNLIQCCTLLGLCFMDKGLPAIAVQWYERALQAPGLDPEGALALRYDMGVAHEQAGHRKAALDCFMEVYGLNVDFRDVGERIRQLQQ